MVKVTYLLGAGASYPTLPIVDQMNRDIYEYMLKIDNEQKLTMYPDVQYKATLQNVHEDFKWLLRNAEEYISVDTFAYQLKLSGNLKDLRKLKLVLSIYFILKQSTSRLEPRYRNFLASILKPGDYGTPYLKEEVKILSWNYDAQLELAAMDYFKVAELTDIQDYIGFHPRLNSMLHSRQQIDLVHLNGIAGFYENESQGNLKIVNLISRGKMLHTILEEIYYIYNAHNKKSSYFDNMFTYSWEKGRYDKSGIELAKKIAEDTNVLVVIGYSFPDYNAEIDQEIFVSFRKLRKIVIQNPNKYSSNFRTKYRISSGVEIEHHKDVERFLSPGDVS